MNLPKFPDPAAKDNNGRKIYETNESLMIDYQKAFGMAEAVRLINQMMDQQEAKIANYITRNEQQREQF